MSCHLIIYTDEKFRERGESIEKRFEKSPFKSVIHYKSELLPNEFFEEHKSILSQKKGAGYWLWKPYILLDVVLRNKGSNDNYVYIDAGDTAEGGLPFVAEKELEDSDLCLTTGYFRQRDWTKRDCFVYMDCDEEKYWNAIQIEAGAIMFKATDFTQKIFEEWFEFCKDERVLTDSPSKFPNHNGFKDHRHDQSILTNLKVKHSLKESSEIRNQLRCNTYHLK